MAQQGEVATAFDVDATTVWRWQRAYAAIGLAGLLAAKRGPKGPRKLTTELAARITAMAANGATLATIAAACEVSTDTVRRALGRGKSATPARSADAAVANDDDAAAKRGTPSGADNDLDADLDTDDLDTEDEPAGTSTPDSHGERDQPDRDDAADDGGTGTGAARDLPVLADPVPRTCERALARAGLLTEAASIFTEGARLPLAGLALVLPALAGTGLLAAMGEVYAKMRGGFYGLRATVLMLVFLALAREPRAEGATRLPPGDLGRLLGPDRGPEVKTIRRKLAELAARGRAGELGAALARQHGAARPDALGFLHVDGHVRVYTGTRRLPKAHVTRMRIAAPAMCETWVGDADGDPVFVVTAAPAASLVVELRALLPQLRELVGADRRVTVVFDRGGYSPALFAEIIAAGFDLLTYRKGPLRREPAKAFRAHTFTDPDGRTHSYDLADRGVRLALPKARAGQPKTARKTVRLRQVTRRSSNGHQTPVLTSRADLVAGAVAYRMSNRWRQENYFKYGRAHFALDALDSYAAVADDPDRSVPNPAKNTARKKVSLARSALSRAEAALASAVEVASRDVRGGAGGSATVEQGVTAAVEVAREQLADAKKAAAATPARVALAAVDPDAKLLDEERKLLTHAIRMSAYNAESALARLLRPHYARAAEEARALLREAFTLSGDIEVVGSELHVRLDLASAPRRSRALAALCVELTATETLYPTRT